MSDLPQEPQPEQSVKRYPIIITHHARQRWLERVVDPKKYLHLRRCSDGGNCSICIQLIHELRDIMQNVCASLDRSISARALASIRNNERVTDPLFLDSIKRWFAEEWVEPTEYYIDRQGQNTIVFVIRREPDGRPIVVTVLTWDMIDGITMMANMKDSKKFFDIWKRQTRQRI
jgi:hypothetical protein